MTNFLMESPVDLGALAGRAALPNVLAVMSDANTLQASVAQIPDRKLFIKAIAALCAELQHRQISYTPAAQERVMLRALLRSTHNRWKKSGDADETLDEFVDLWLKTGMPHVDWVLRA